MIDKIKSLFSSEEYSPVALFEVKNVISGEGRISLPSEKKRATVVKIVEKKVKKPVVKKSKVKKKSVLSIVQVHDEPVNSTDLLQRCLDENICSRATFFRKMNKLVKDGSLKRTKEGKEVFYSVK